MRRIRDGEATRETVINAAKVVFAKNGFAGSSLAMISEKSGISDGLILHHFKSKENLYHVVLEELASEYLIVINSAAAGAQNEEQVAIEVLRAVFQYWKEDKLYHRISMWAYLENRHELVEQEMQLTAGLAETVQTMQAGGQVDGRFSPYAMLTMIIGPMHFWMRYHDLFRQAMQYPGRLEDMDRDFEKQFIQLVLKIFQPEGGYIE